MLILRTTPIPVLSHTSLTDQNVNPMKEDILKNILFWPIYHYMSTTDPGDIINTYWTYAEWITGWMTKLNMTWKIFEKELSAKLWWPQSWIQNMQVIQNKIPPSWPRLSLNTITSTADPVLCWLLFLSALLPCCLRLKPWCSKCYSLLLFSWGSHRHSHPSVYDVVSIVISKIIATWRKVWRLSSSNNSLQDVLILNKFWNRSIRHDH